MEFVGNTTCLLSTRAGRAGNARVFIFRNFYRRPWERTAAGRCHGGWRVCYSVKASRNLCFRVAAQIQTCAQIRYVYRNSSGRFATLATMCPVSRDDILLTFAFLRGVNNGVFYGCRVRSARLAREAEGAGGRVVAQYGRTSQVHPAFIYRWCRRSRARWREGMYEYTNQTSWRFYQ
jgi:hypothetical protein